MHNIAAAKSLREAVSDIAAASSGSFSNDEAKRALSAIHLRARLSPTPEDEVSV